MKFAVARELGLVYNVSLVSVNESRAGIELDLRRLQHLLHHVEEIVRFARTTLWGPKANIA